MNISLERTHLETKLKKTKKTAVLQLHRMIENLNRFKRSKSGFQRCIVEAMNWNSDLN